MAGRVALVAGATRGAGRGIARALGEAGAVVYCTGRSVRGNPSPYGRPETIEETAEMIQAAGGAAIAVRCDHTVESEVSAVFDRLDREQGRIDVVAISVAGEDPTMPPFSPFWEADLTGAEATLRQTLLSHIVTAKHAALRMRKRRRGLIVEVTENDMLFSSGGIVTQVAKLAQKGLAAFWAAELRRSGVACVAVTPGFLRSERMLELFGVTEENWREAGKKDPNFLESESPMFVGRTIAALAMDPELPKWSGQTLSSWELGRRYRVTDLDGRRPDWGAVDVDLSVLPATLTDAMTDTLDVQTRWLQALSRRTKRYRVFFAERVRASRRRPRKAPR